jgi:hypothetical protein
LLRFYREQCENEDDASVIGYNQLKSKASNLVHPNSFDLVLDELVARGELSVGRSKNGERVLKFKVALCLWSTMYSANKFKERSSRGPAQLTDVDVSVHELRSTMAKIETEIKRLEERSEK